jgi:flagellar biosynthetic protein FliR
MDIAVTELMERFYGLIWPMLRTLGPVGGRPYFFFARIEPAHSDCAGHGPHLVVVHPMHQWPQIDPLSAPGMMEICNQLMIGMLMGLMLQVVTAAIVVAGQSIANAIGLSMATMVDPNMGNVPVISQFLLVMATLILWAWACLVTQLGR